MRVRQHVNPLGLFFTTYRDQIPELQSHRPVEVEIGCADAQFLFERARVAPEHQLIGLEIRGGCVDQVNERALAESAPVQALLCHANNHLRTVFADASVDRVHLLFPDPWFKKRQRKRRVVDLELARDIIEILKPGGELHFASDVWSVALEALAVFEECAGRLDNACGPWSFWREANPYGARSWREEHCESAGNRVWRIIYRRPAD